MILSFSLLDFLFFFFFHNELFFLFFLIVIISLAPRAAVVLVAAWQVNAYADQSVFFLSFFSLFFLLLPPFSSFSPLFLSSFFTTSFLF